MADLGVWRESWADYSQCQHMQDQDKDICAAALRQCLDDDLKRYIREGVISFPSATDVCEIIAALHHYIRSQRNPLLDRIEFYKRHRENGESFDNFYTCLRELYTACNFESYVLCGTCHSACCATCQHLVTTALANDTLRNRIVIGVSEDETRHKLLAMQKLTLDAAITTCRSEEAARQTTDSLPTPGLSVNAARCSTYQKRKTQPARESGKSDKPSSPARKCPNCGRSTHTKSVCPAADKVCSALSCCKYTLLLVRRLVFVGK
eukprot:scpid93830/ scgid9294/ 